MIKTFTALAAAGVIALMTAVAPKPAAAGDGGAIAAGIIGGVAAGAIIAGAARPAPPPPPAYAPAYYPPPGPPPGRDCYYDRPRYWDQYAGEWRRGPRRLVCD